MTNGFLFPLSSAISSGQKRESERLVLLFRGPFFNYVDQVLLIIINQLPTYPWLTLARELLYCFGGKSAYP
jgi:hypothetical protein